VFVVKHLRGAGVREAGIYGSLLTAGDHVGVPAMLGVEETDPAQCYLYLEAVHPWRRWPWADVEAVGRVLDALAALHGLPRLTAAQAAALAWDYDRELAQSAASTLVEFERMASHPELALARDALSALRRLVDVLPAMRRELRASTPVTAIHGDTHTGNVLLRQRQGVPRPVLLDWGRARLGSPLEDVAAWLQSVGLWVPAARQQHDALLLRYLSACGTPATIGRTLHDAYWLASASNVLGGTLRHAMARLAGWGSRTPRARADARRVAEAAARVLSRADACWRA
jgi:aminoglycoside phosphotransferase (APT) family kinase protein